MKVLINSLFVMFALIGSNALAHPGHSAASHAAIHAEWLLVAAVALVLVVAHFRRGKQ